MRAFRIASSARVSTPRLSHCCSQLPKPATRTFGTVPAPPFHRRDIRRPDHLRYPKQSALDPLVFLVGLAFGIGASYIKEEYFSSTKPEEASSLDESASSAPSLIDSDLDMAPTLLPGRPGNLTADQEEKLRELWLATLDVFGVTHGQRTSFTAAPGSSTPAHADDKTKKKSKLSMFSRKNKEGDASADNTDDENDKHGQAKEFRQAIQNQSPESLHSAFWGMVKHDDPDALLLRFLRARKWDVHAALVMMISTLHWRAEEMHVDDDIVFKGEGGALHDSKSASDATTKKDAEDFLTQLRMGKSYLHGLDSEGRPICTVRARLHRAGEQSEKSLERYTVYTIDTARMMLRPPIDTAVSVSGLVL